MMPSRIASLVLSASICSMDAVLALTPQQSFLNRLHRLEGLETAACLNDEELVCSKTGVRMQGSLASLRVRPLIFWLRYCELKLARRLAGIFDSMGPEPACTDRICLSMLY